MTCLQGDTQGILCEKRFIYMFMSVTRLLGITQTRHRLMILISIWLNMNRPRLLPWQPLSSICAEVCQPVDGTTDHTLCARKSIDIAVNLMLSSTSQIKQPQLAEISSAPVSTCEVSVNHRLANASMTLLNVPVLLCRACLTAGLRWQPEAKAHPQASQSILLTCCA